MACKFCFLGCPINDKFNCCFECDNQKECISNGRDCKGMGKEFKECQYYEKTT